jgi:hypothetical protein
VDGKREREKPRIKIRPDHGWLAGGQHAARLQHMLDYIIIPPRKEGQTERGPRRFHRHPDFGQCGTAVVGGKRTKTVPEMPTWELFSDLRFRPSSSNYYAAPGSERIYHENYCYFLHLHHFVISVRHILDNIAISLIRYRRRCY